jgi:hypothetical protein
VNCMTVALSRDRSEIQLQYSRVDLELTSPSFIRCFWSSGAVSAPHLACRGKLQLQRQRAAPRGELLAHA